MRGAVVIAVLAGCAGRPTVEDELRAAIDDLRESESYRYEFAVRTEMPGSDSFDAKGISVVSGDVLSTEVKATGQLHRIIVASGERAVIWHPNLEAWVDSVAYGEPEAGRGVQSPTAIFSAIEEELESSTVEVVKGRSYVITFEGEGLRQVSRRLGLGAGGEGSVISVRIGVDEKRRIEHLSIYSRNAAASRTEAEVKFVGSRGAKVIPDPTVGNRMVLIAEALKELGLDPTMYKP